MSQVPADLCESDIILITTSCWQQNSSCLCPVSITSCAKHRPLLCESWSQLIWMHGSKSQRKFLIGFNHMVFDRCRWWRWMASFEDLSGVSKKSLITRDVCMSAHVTTEFMHDDFSYQLKCPMRNLAIKLCENMFGIPEKPIYKIRHE